MAGVLAAIVAIAYAGSFGQLIFDGVLSRFVGQGIMAALVSSTVVMLVQSWRSSFGFSIGGPDSNPSAVLAVTLATIAGSVVASGGVDSPELLPTIQMYVCLSATICGLIVWLLGRWGGGRYVRFIPHPVVGGFLAGTGYLLVAGAFRTLTGVPLGFGALLNPPPVQPLAVTTALAVAILLTVLSRRLRHFLVIPGVIVLAVVAFHAVRAGLGIDLATARTAGLLLPPVDLSVWQSPGALSVGPVRWDILLHHAKDFGAMTVVVVVAVLLNTTSIELATGRDADADVELRAIGVGNILAGLLGGMVASNSFNRTVLNLRAGANSRWASRIAAGIVVGLVALAPGVVGLLPKPVLTGLILFLGSTLLATWVFDARRTLSRLDHAVVLIILGIVAWHGIVAGVVIGIFIACVTLAFTLSRSPTVRHAFTAQNRRANVERTSDEIERLRLHGGLMRGYSLQGVLFFGTASRLLDEVRRGLESTRIVLLDFRLVNGADSSSIVTLGRLQNVCRASGVRIAVTGLTEQMAAVLQRGGFDLGGTNVRRFADLDRGLEWCEEYILGQREQVRAEADALGAALAPAGARLFAELCERRRISAGQVLVRRGDPGDQMFFVVSGRIQVQLRLEHGSGVEIKRLRTFGPGTVVGEMGFYSGEPRSADIVAEQDAEVFCLTRETFDTIESRDPAMARAIDRYVIKTLSERLRCANDEIRTLL